MRFQQEMLNSKKIGGKQQMLKQQECIRENDRLRSAKNADYSYTEKGNGKEGQRVLNRESNDYKLTERGDD